MLVVRMGVESRTVESRNSGTLASIDGSLKRRGVSLNGSLGWVRSGVRSQD